MKVLDVERARLRGQTFSGPTTADEPDVVGLKLSCSCGHSWSARQGGRGFTRSFGATTVECPRCHEIEQIKDSALP